MNLTSRFNPPTSTMDRSNSVMVAAQPFRAKYFHTVDSGETLPSIAKKYYGNGSMWPRLFSANAGLLGGGINVQPGQSLLIP